MKHLLRGLFIAVLFICCNFQLVLAQPMQELPVDKNVRIGKLDNGLTYYIRHNALPEKRVEFYIAQKVGSILEMDAVKLGFPFRGIGFLRNRNNVVWLTFWSTWLSTEQSTSQVMKPDLASCPGVKQKVSNSART